MDNYEQLQSELHAANERIRLQQAEIIRLRDENSDKDRRFDLAQDVIRLQGAVIRVVADPNKDDLAFLMESNGSDTIQPRQA